MGFSRAFGLLTFFFMIGMWMIGMGHKIKWGFPQDPLFLLALGITNIIPEKMETILQCKIRAPGSHPVFVWILALPLIFWTKDVFKEMGNLLGFYYEVYFVENTQQYWRGGGVESILCDFLNFLSFQQIKVI